MLVTLVFIGANTRKMHKFIIVILNMKIMITGYAVT